MPVFFYIDPEFTEDPNLMDVRAAGKAHKVGQEYRGKERERTRAKRKKREKKERGKKKR